MKAAVLHAIGDLRVEDRPRPVAGPGMVLLRVGSCGVCGSDLPRVFTKGTYHFPTICGHEFAGTVAELGAGVDDLAVGQAATVFPLIWCGKCAACEQGEYARCADYDYLGSRRDGGFAEFVAVPRRNLLPLPAGVAVELGAMVEPAAVALHALRRGGGCAPGETVAVFGAGPIGLMVAQWARAMGAARVAIFDLVPEALSLAKCLGFTDVYDVRQADSAKTLAALTGGRLAEVAVEAAGVPATLAAAIAAAGNGGRVILLGNPSADVTLPAPLLSLAMRRELRLCGTWNSSYSATGNHDDWHTVVAALVSGALNLEPLITHRLPLAEAAAGFAMMRGRKEYFCKVLIHP
jgi:L-iditol 2-dehydrogenase